MNDDSYEGDFTFNCNDTANHPDKYKMHQIWINIGCEFGGTTQLTMGVGEPNSDGFYKSYVSFDMNTARDIMEVMSMLNSALDMLKEYNDEFWDGEERK